MNCITTFDLTQSAFPFIKVISWLLIPVTFAILFWMGRKRTGWPAYSILTSISLVFFLVLLNDFLQQHRDWETLLAAKNIAVAEGEIQNHQLVRSKNATYEKFSVGGVEFRYGILALTMRYFPIHEPKKILTKALRISYVPQTSGFNGNLNPIVKIETCQ